MSLRSTWYCCMDIIVRNLNLIKNKNCGLQLLGLFAVRRATLAVAARTYYIPRIRRTTYILCFSCVAMFHSAPSKSYRIHSHRASRRRINTNSPSLLVHFHTVESLLLHSLLMLLLPRLLLLECRSHTSTATACGRGLAVIMVS